MNIRIDSSKMHFWLSDRVNILGYCLVRYATVINYIVYIVKWRQCVNLEQKIYYSLVQNLISLIRHLITLELLVASSSFIVKLSSDKIVKNICQNEDFDGSVNRGHGEGVHVFRSGARIDSYLENGKKKRTAV